MGVTEQVTLLQTGDGSGNKTIHYPVTKVGCVDGLDEYLEEQLEGLTSGSGSGGMLPQLIVTVTSGSTVTCSLGATTLTVTSTGTATFDLPSYGTWTVTASLNGATTSDAVSITAVKQYSLALAFFSQVTPAQIQEAVDAGVASSRWSVGDEVSVTLKSGEKITLAIMGFSHDDLTSGGKAGITFGMKNLMASSRAMNSSNTNAGGFTSSAMYTWLQGDMLADLPDEWQAIIKTVNKKTSAGSASSTINTNSMKLFLFSEVEIFGTTTYSAAGEGAQYPYFTTSANRTKYLSNGTGSTSAWWERSPDSSSSTSFCGAHIGGGASSISASYSRGVCFGFCV